MTMKPKKKKSKPKKEVSSDILNIITNIARKIAPYFQFGYFEYDDIIQEAILGGLKGYNKYKRNKGDLISFLTKTMKNHLINLKRDHSCRPNPPCKGCSFNVAAKCTLFDEINDCLKYKNWCIVNAAKKSICNRSSVDNMDGVGSREDHLKDVERAEFFDLIDEYLPTKYRGDLLKILDDVHISKVRRQKLYEEIRGILNLEDYK